MRKLAYLLVAMPLLGTLEAADACTDRLLSYEQLLAKASTVFIGRIIRTEEAGTVQEYSHMSPVPVVEGTFRVVGVLKGEPPTNGKVKAIASLHCNVRLLAGQSYAIFLYGDNFIRSHHEGTTPVAEDVDATRLLELLHENEEEREKRKLEMRKQMLEQLSFQQKLLLEGKVGDCYMLSDEQAFAQAATVFFGHLTRTEEIEAQRTGDASPTPVVEATFQVLDLLKGHAPPDGKVRSAGVPKACMPYLSVDLLPGDDFLVFLDQHNLVLSNTRSLLVKYDDRYRKKWRDLRGEVQ
jgi:hypothetical protein